MPVTFDNIAKSQSTGTALQFNLTVGANAVLLAYFVHDSVNQRSVSAVAYGGVAMTRLGSTLALGTNNIRMEVWGLTAPAAGSNVLSAQFAQSDLWYGFGVSYLNATGTTPFGTVASATSGGATVLNLSVSSTSTDLISFFMAATGAITLSNGTQRQTAGSQAIVVGDIAGAGPETVSATNAGSITWGGLGLSIRFSAAAASTLRFTRAMTGVGH